MELKRVVVTGLGALTPIGNNIEELWNNLVKGVSGANMITRFDASKFKTQFACELKNFDPKDFFDRKEARKYDPYAQYGMVAAGQCLKDSGIDREKIDLDRAGVIWASGIGGLDTFEKEVGGYSKADGPPRFNPFFIPKMFLLALHQPTHSLMLIIISGLIKQIFLYQVVPKPQLQSVELEDLMQCMLFPPGMTTLKQGRDHLIKTGTDLCLVKEEAL